MFQIAKFFGDESLRTSDLQNHLRPAQLAYNAIPQDHPLYPAVLNNVGRLESLHDFFVSDIDARLYQSASEAAIRRTMTEVEERPLDELDAATQRLQYDVRNKKAIDSAIIEDLNELTRERPVPDEIRNGYERVVSERPDYLLIFFNSLIADAVHGRFKGGLKPFDAFEPVATVDDVADALEVNLNRPDLAINLRTFFRDVDAGKRIFNVPRNWWQESVI